MIGAGVGIGGAAVRQFSASDPVSALFADGARGLYLDASRMGDLFQDPAATLPVTAAGQPIGQWRDARDAGLRLTAFGDGARPIFQASGQGTGDARLVCDGIDDGLQIADRFGMPADPAMTVIAALNTGAQSRADERLFELGAGAGSISGAVGQEGLSFRYNNGNLIFDPLPGNAEFVVAWVRSSGDPYGEGRCFVDGAPVAARSSVNGSRLPASTAALLTLFRSSGGVGPFGGALRRFLLVDRVLSEDQISELSALFAAG